MGLEVSRPFIPVSIQISEKEKYSHHADVYPVRVSATLDELQIN